MHWATYAIEQLQQGRQARVRPRGHSMTGRVNDGDLVTLEPTAPERLQVGDIVLVQVKGQVYLHLIKAINQSRFLIGNNRGRINGWVGHHAIYGRAIHISSQ